MINNILLKSRAVTEYFKKPYFGFINSLDHIPVSEIQKIKSLVECDDSSIQEEFEDKFSKLIGSGYGVSFATGRMGFYALLKLLKIGKDDEVILLGSTCSVMVNAILRCNATPIYSDINTENYGSDKESILLKNF